MTSTVPLSPGEARRAPSGRPPAERGRGALEPAGATLEQTVGEREGLATLLDDLEALPQRQRAALVMRELNGLSISEIAAALSASRGAAKQMLYEAHCALHEFAEGREMDCAHVRRSISDGDGRALRARRMRAPVRECAG